MFASVKSRAGELTSDRRVQSYVASSSETQLGILSTMSAPQLEGLPSDDLPSA